MTPRRNKVGKSADCIDRTLEYSCTPPKLDMDYSGIRSHLEERERERAKVGQHIPGGVNSNSPLQALPFDARVNPGEQAHLKLPLVLTQTSAQSVPPPC